MLKLIELARFTPDVAATTRFYERLLGCKPAAQYSGMSEFHLDDLVLRIHKTYQPEDGDLPPEDHIAFAVRDIETACRDAESFGLTLEVPPTVYEWGKSAYLRDPDGRLVELHEIHRDA